MMFCLVSGATAVPMYFKGFFSWSYTEVPSHFDQRFFLEANPKKKKSNETATILK
jgi:hypothetical protein